MVSWGGKSAVEHEEFQVEAADLDLPHQNLAKYNQSKSELGTI